MEEDRAGFDALQTPITDLRKAQKFYAEQMRRLLNGPTPLAFAPTFVELGTLFVVAAQAKVRALMLYAGEAAAELDAFEEKWAGKYASIAPAWQRAWQEVIPFFGSILNFVYLVWPMRVLDAVTH